MSRARSGSPPGRESKSARPSARWNGGLQAQRRAPGVEVGRHPAPHRVNALREVGVPDVAQVDGDGRLRAVPRALEAGLELERVEGVRAPASSGGEGGVGGSDVGPRAHESVGGHRVAPQLQRPGRGQHQRVERGHLDPGPRAIEVAHGLVEAPPRAEAAHRVHVHPGRARREAGILGFEVAMRALVMEAQVSVRGQRPGEGAGPGGVFGLLRLAECPVEVLPPVARLHPPRPEALGDGGLRARARVGVGHADPRDVLPHRVQSRDPGSGRAPSGCPSRSGAPALAATGPPRGRTLAGRSGSRSR